MATQARSTRTKSMLELERIARTAPRRWRTDAALKRAGFRPVRGSLSHALRASRLARLTRELAAARRRAGMTQAAVARLIGTTASAVSRMESDHPGNLTIATIDRYASAVNAELLLAVRPVRPNR